MPWLLGWTQVLEDPAVNKTFDVALHIGTLAAVVVYFAPDLWRLLGALGSSIRHRRIESSDERLVWLLLAATVPAALLGVAFESFFERKAGQPWVIAIALAVFGLVMAVIDRLKGRRELDDLRGRDALVVGAAQAGALVPGVSRSGITITAAVALGLTRETAARFSFLLSIPVIAGAGAFKGLKLVKDGFPSQIGPGSFALGIVASALSGFLAVAVLLRYLRRGSLTPFVIYRLVVGAGVLLVIATGFRHATLPG